MPTQPPTGAVVFGDEFGPGDTNHWTAAPEAGATVLKSSGNLAVTASKGAYAKVRALELENIDTSNVAVQVDALAVEGAGRYGVVCRDYSRGESASSYEFDIRDDNYVALFKSDPSYGTSALVYWAATAALHPRGSNRLVAVCRNTSTSFQDGVELELWLNGLLVIDFTDLMSPLLRGEASLFVQAHDAHSSLMVEYDNLTVESLS
jgi:hypothetical protein